MSFNCYTPKEAMEIVSRTGYLKANMRLDKVFFSAVNAGFVLAFACATSLSTNSSPWYQENAPGLIRTIGAIIFPYGLCIIVVTGLDLCTGSFMFTTVAAVTRRISPLKMVIHWFVTFFGNLAGSLFVVCIITGYGGVFDSAAYKAEAISFATTKQVTPEWHMVFLRAIGANWLVCLAIYLGLIGRDLASKIIGIWFPTFGFVSLGFDHVVANMFFVPMGIWQGAPNLTVGLYIWKGIIPAFLGNLIGGGLFVGVLYWYLHLEGETAIAVDGQPFGGGHTVIDAERGIRTPAEPDLESGKSDKERTSA